MNKKANTYNIVLGGLIAALSILLMLLTALFPMANIILPAIAGILLICTVFEMGEGWSFLIYAVTGILSFLILPSKSPAVYYVLFLGHYPILKSIIERLNNKTLQWIIKIAVFNVCSLSSLFIVKSLFGFPGGILKYGLVPVIILLNAAFVVFDIALSGIVGIYGVRIRKLILRK